MISDKQVEAACLAFAGKSFGKDHAAKFDDGYRAAIRLALEAAEAAAWQDIATAPRDGTGFLAYHAIEAGNQWAFLLCYWADGYAGLGWYTVDLFDTRNEQHIAPSHWRPLPQPPKEPT